MHQIDQPYLDALSNGLSYLVNCMTGQPIYAHITSEKGERFPLADLASALLLVKQSTSYLLEDHIVDKTFPTGTNPGDWGEIRTASGMNDDVWIVGMGNRRFSGSSFPTSRAYLLIPTTIPEPLAVVLRLLAGAGAAGCCRR